MSYTNKVRASSSREVCPKVRTSSSREVCPTVRASSSREVCPTVRASSSREVCPTVRASSSREVCPTQIKLGLAPPGRCVLHNIRAEVIELWSQLRTRATKIHIFTS